jgi:ribosomal protein L10
MLLQQIKTQSRSLASAVEKTLFKPFLTPPEAVSALEKVKLSKRGNPVSARKTYWYETYKHILQNQKYLFVLQNNNIPSQTLLSLKKELKKSGLENLTVRNSVFKACAKDLKKPEIANLFQGQNIVLFTNNDNDQVIKDVGKIALKFRDHLLLVGGDIEGMVVTNNTFNMIKTMPSKQQLFQQILGIIQQPAHNIVSLLGQTPQMLAATLDQHEKNLNQ